ncbi:MAG TPA: hypothetical protein VIB07_07955 [Nitrososphaera sp.]|jgi:hypothetical protein
MLFELVMIFATLAVGSNATGIDGALATGDSIGLVEATADQALRSIRAAEASGADVSHLTEKFNTALDFQRQAKENTFTSCSGPDECVIQANDLLLSIVDESSSIRSAAAAGREAADILTFTVYVPLSSFIVSVATILLYSMWKSRRTKKFEALEIHQKGSS